MNLPKKINIGDKIGVIAPSSPITKEKMKEINNSIKLMEDSGFKIEFSKNAFKNTLGYGATAKEKAEDINNMFADPNINAIFCATGGANSNSTFEYLDYELISKNYKIFCGFSDSTSITNIITEKCGFVTFNGPTLKSLTSWKTDYAYRQVMKRFVYGDLALREKEDEFIVIKEGVTEGELIGGNLSLICNLCSGKYNVNFENKILFIEELAQESYPELISNYLYKMKQNGVFEKINGIWVGNYESEIALEKILLDTIGEDINIPIIKSNNFGHTEKKMVIPIGAKAKIDTTEEEKIILIEECVKK